MSRQGAARSPLVWRMLAREAPALLALAAPFLASLGGRSVSGLAWVGISGYLILLLAPAIDPRQRVRWDQKPLPWARLGVAVVCAVGALVQARALTDGDAERALRIELLTSVVLLGVLGNAMPALRPNWFFGIRTPWTLRDDRVWDRTHRVAGHALVAASVVLAALWAVLDPSRFATLLGGVICTIVLLTVAYSWHLSRPISGRPTPDEPG